MVTEIDIKYPSSTTIIDVYNSFKYNPSEKIDIEKLVLAITKLSRSNSILLTSLIVYHHLDNPETENIFSVPYKCKEIEIKINGKREKKLEFKLKNFPKSLIYILYKFCNLK